MTYDLELIEEGQAGNFSLNRSRDSPLRDRSSASGRGLQHFPV